MQSIHTIDQGPLVFLFQLCSLHEQLRHVLKGVAHERSDVTRDALKSLYSLLKNNKVKIPVGDLLCFRL